MRSKDVPGDIGALEVLEMAADNGRRAVAWTVGVYVFRPSRDARRRRTVRARRGLSPTAHAGPDADRRFWSTGRREPGVPGTRHDEHDGERRSTELRVDRPGGDFFGP